MADVEISVPAKYEEWTFEYKAGYRDGLRGSKTRPAIIQSVNRLERIGAYRAAYTAARVEVRKAARRASRGKEGDNK